VVDVRVLNSAGTSPVNAPGDQFTYTAVTPSVTSISPTSGRRRVDSGDGHRHRVRHQRRGGEVRRDERGQLQCGLVDADHGDVAVDNHAGAVDVTVTNTAGTSGDVASGEFTYATVTPAVTSISPTSGPTGGGTAVTITGTGSSPARPSTLAGTAATV